MLTNNLRQLPDQSFRTNNQFLNFIQSWTRYLNKNSYSVTPACVLDFYKIVNQIDLLNIDQFCGISKSLFAKNQMEFVSHDDFFNRFIRKHMKSAMDDMLKQEKEWANQKMQQLQDDYDRQQEELRQETQKRLDELLQKLMGGQMAAAKKHQKLLSQMDPEALEQFEQLCQSEPPSLAGGFLNLDPATLEKLLQNIQSFPHEDLKNDLNTLMLAHLSQAKPNPKVSELLIQGGNMLQKMGAAINKEAKWADMAIKDREKELEDQLAAIKKQLADQKKRVLIKNGTINHREGSFVGKNSVLDLAKIQDQTICDLSQMEYESLLAYIQLNAAKFRTKLSRSMRQSSAKVFDYRATMRHSIKCFGIPMKLYYKRPVVKKYKLVCFLDVSGSVSQHLKLLASFIYEINSVFNGGVYTYGFVSNLIDFTEIFREENVDQVVRELTGRRGYSDYNKALSDFNELYLNKVDRNTIVLFFGDARNNKNPSGREYLEAIRDRSRGIVWLNPEVKGEWYTGDSALKVYEPVIGQLFPASKTGDLIRFMDEFSVDALKM